MSLTSWIARKLGLTCGHKHLSRPMSNAQRCLDCGELLAFAGYNITQQDKVQAYSVDHYKVTENNVRRIQQQPLKFGRRKA